MAYVLSLVLIIGIAIFTFGADLNYFSPDINTPIQNLKNIIAETFPKSEREILFERIQEDQDILKQFFSNSSQPILNSKDISAETKKEFTKSLEALMELSKGIDSLDKPGDSSKNIISGLIKKLVDIPSEPKVDPTSIPPNCELVCQ